MNEFFMEIAKISLYAAVITAVVWIVRATAGKRLSAKFRCAAWMILVIRLLLPFEIPSTFSLFSLVPEPAEQVIQSTFTAPQGNEIPVGAELQNEQPAAGLEALPAVPKEQPPVSWSTVLSWVWIAGIGVMLLFFALTYGITAYRLRRPAAGDFFAAAQCFAENRILYLPRGKARLWVTDAYHSPFLFGALRPRIVVPRAMAERGDSVELSAMFAHELVHIRKKHAVWNVLLYFLKSVYWFNPAVWLAFFLMKQDMEMLCDEFVVKGCTQAEKRGYAQAVVDAVARVYALPPGAALFSEKKFLKERIRNIMKHKNTKLYSSVAGGVLLLFLSFILLTTGKPLSIQLGTDENLQQMQQNQTQYVGDNAKVGALISLLDDDYSGFYEMDHFELQTAEKPYGVTIYYVWKEDAMGHIPYRSSQMENNALLLMCFIQNADRIEFAMVPTKEDLETKNEDMINRNVFTREEMEKKFGSLDKLAADISKLSKTLEDNRGINAEVAHFNRCRWGGDQELVLYRNGDPDEIIKNEDGSMEMIYKNLGEVTHTMEGGTVEVIPGNDIKFYLNSPDAIRHGLTGIYRFDTDGPSETIYNIGLDENATKAQLVEKLGEPVKTEINAGVERYLYSTYENESWYLYFDFSNDRMVQHGITVEYAD